MALLYLRAMLSQRVSRLLTSPSPILSAHLRCHANPFSSDRNPTGYINFGTAENYLMWDLLEPKLAASRAVLAADTHYNPVFGLEAFRQSLARFCRRTFGPHISAENLVVANGVTSIVDMLGFALAEPGDGFLIPAPYYSGFDIDLQGRAQVVPVPAYQSSANGFTLTRGSLEGGKARAEADGIRLRALLLTTPTNPLGRSLLPAECEAAFQFCEDYDLPCLVDEVYGNSAYDGPAFESILRDSPEVNRYRHRLHFIYGMSKDFTLAGFRVGVCHTEDEKLRTALQRLCYFNNSSTDTQRTLALMLDDEPWVDRYLEANRSRLAEAYAHFKRLLEAGSEARCLPGQTGVFTFIDMRFALEKPTFEAESALFQYFVDNAKVNILPGGAFHCAEPGWFRACFAHPADARGEGARRLNEALEKLTTKRSS